MPIDFEASGIDYLISSANKCLEGVPGVAFVFGRASQLIARAGNARSLSLDLAAQLIAFEKTGKFRFAPPTHVLLALHQALIELELEGGVKNRNARYSANHRCLVEGMMRLGFRPFLAPLIQSPIITAFHYPESFDFDFSEFYHRLATEGMIIYPGKLTEVETFRIGNIGRLFEPDIRALLAAVAAALEATGIDLKPKFEYLDEIHG